MTLPPTTMAPDVNAPPASPAWPPAGQPSCSGRRGSAATRPVFAALWRAMGKSEGAGSDDAGMGVRLASGPRTVSQRISLASVVASGAGSVGLPVGRAETERIQPGLLVLGAQQT